MRFFVEIDMDNDAFADGNAPVEVSRLLEAVSERVAGYQFKQTGRNAFPLRDINGNRVGTYGYEGHEEDEEDED